MMDYGKDLRKCMDELADSRETEAQLVKRVEELEGLNSIEHAGCEQALARMEAAVAVMEAQQERAEAAEAKLAELQRSYDFMSGEAYKREQAEAKLARCVEALEKLLGAWDRAEGGRGCYSCAELHDCRCELDRKISTVCTCGRVELDAAAEAARAALAAAKGGE